MAKLIKILAPCLFCNCNNSSREPIVLKCHHSSFINAASCVTTRVPAQGTLTPHVSLVVHFCHLLWHYGRIYNSTFEWCDMSQLGRKQLLAVLKYYTEPKRWSGCVGIKHWAEAQYKALKDVKVQEKFVVTSLHKFYPNFSAPTALQTFLVTLSAVMSRQLLSALINPLSTSRHRDTE